MSSNSVSVSDNSSQESDIEGISVNSKTFDIQNDKQRL
jgi:hypothetical protein